MGLGKALQIKAIMGLLPVTNGSVEFGGANKYYAYIPEHPVLYEGLTLWEHLELAAAAYEIERKTFETRADDLLRLFRLSEVKHNLPSSFSKGMQQKIMLILGFLLEPSVYIVDEPFMGLDPRATRDFLALINKARTKGAGVKWLLWLVYSVMLTNALGISWLEVINAPFVSFFPWQPKTKREAAKKAIFLMALPGQFLLGLVIALQTHSWLGAISMIPFGMVIVYITSFRIALKT